MCEGDAEAVGADFPIHGVGDGFEVGEEGYAAAEVGEFAEGDFVEAVVFEGARGGVSMHGGTGKWGTHDVKA